MKSLMFPLCISLVLISCQIEAQDYSGLVLKPILKGDYNLPQFRDSIAHGTPCYFLVELKIINESQLIKEFIIYSCSATECLILDQDCVQVCFNNCGKNSITLISLKPGQVYSLPIILQQKKDTCRIRIGFIPISPKIKRDYLSELLERHKNHKDIIWSDPLQLVPGGGQIYEVK